MIVDQLAHNGGLFLFDKYLQTKDNPHCTRRLMQFFEEGTQFSFFPGDPGEDDHEFDSNWTAEAEPVSCEIDHWATKIVKSKQVVKVDNQIDDAPSSSRSRRAPSIASSRRTIKMRKNTKNDDLKSRQGNDSNRDKSERKENLMTNLSVNAISQHSLVQQVNIVPLETEPTREIPDDERILRDRKERQIKIKEQEAKEQREKEERERQRMKNKQDAFAEIEKQEYTYDLNGNIIFVKKPKTTGGAQTVVLDYELNPAAREEERKRQEARNNKGKRLLSAKPTQAKELKVIKETKKEDEVLEEKAQKEYQENYQKMMQYQEETLKDYQLDQNLDINAGIILTDKEGKKMRGPTINRENRMTLGEYQKIAAQFDLQNMDQMSRVGSQKRLLEERASQLEYIQEDQESISLSKKRKSPERIQRKVGADVLYERDPSQNEFKINIRQRRKELKSANVKSHNEKIMEKHNKEARLSSAKQQSDVRIRKTSSKQPQSSGTQGGQQKERVYNYENHIGGVDFLSGGDLHSKISEATIGATTTAGRPQSGHPSLLNRKKIAGAMNGLQPSSLVDEFNKKLMEKGPSFGVLPHEMPAISQYLQKKPERPQTSKPLMKNSTSKVRISMGELNDALGPGGAHTQVLAGISAFSGADSIFKSQGQAKKLPRERVISAKVQRETDKLPPPPFGKTMGHGLMKQQM